MQPESAALLWDVHTAATRVAEFISGLDAESYALVHGAFQNS